MIWFLYICHDMDYIFGVTVVLGIVLRCMVSLHPYSGSHSALLALAMSVALTHNEDQM